MQHSVTSYCSNRHLRSVLVRR